MKMSAAERMILANQADIMTALVAMSILLITGDRERSHLAQASHTLTKMVDATEAVIGKEP